MKNLAELTEELDSIEERRSLALADNCVGIWQWNIADHTLIWDHNMLDIYNLSKDNFQGDYTDWAQSLHPEDREAAELSLNHSLFSSDDTKFYQRFRVKYFDTWR